MNRSNLAVLLCLAVLPIIGVAPLQARTINCVPDTGCPEGEGPPSCCQPPPCEFLQALKFERANLRNIEANSFIYGSGSGPDAESLYRESNYKDFEELLEQASPCPDNPFFEPEPILTVDEDQQCEIKIYEDFNDEYDASLDSLLEGSNTCEELVQAEYKEAEAARQICLTERYRSNPRTMQELIMQTLAEAQAKVDELESHMRRYEAACTVAPDGQAAQQAVEDDLVPLTPDPKPKAKKKKAKRSGKKAGR